MTATPSFSSSQRFAVAEMERHVQALFVAVGMDLDKARCVTNALLSADSMGHSTHGLALAPWYLEAARSGVMTISGDKTVVK